LAGGTFGRIGADGGQRRIHAQTVAPGPAVIQPAAVKTVSTPV
jgi:hypothetical protein